LLSNRLRLLLTVVTGMLNFADKPLVDFKSPFGDSKIFNNFLSESDMVAAFLSIFLDTSV
jgi:hypothetical protein